MSYIERKGGKSTCILYIIYYIIYIMLGFIPAFHGGFHLCCCCFVGGGVLKARGRKEA